MCTWAQPCTVLECLTGVTVYLKDLLRSQLEKHPDTCSECLSGDPTAAGKSVLLAAQMFIS